MDLDPDLWFVRNGEEVSGPFTVDEIGAKRRSGKIKWFHDLSQDQLIWFSLDDGRGPSLRPGFGPREELAAIGPGLG